LIPIDSRGIHVGTQALPTTALDEFLAVVAVRYRLLVLLASRRNVCKTPFRSD